MKPTDESKFVHENNLDFALKAKRNKYLALWAADKMHIKASDLPNYIQDVIASDLEEQGDEDIINKVYEDLKKSDLNINKEEVKGQLVNFAKQVIQENYKK